MKIILPQQYQIVIERRYQAERPQRFILQASTDQVTPEKVLTDFYKKSISMIDDVRKKVHAKYPQFYGI